MTAREERRRRADQAATYARKHGTTLDEAAEVFDVHAASVSKAWRRLFGVPAALGKRNKSAPEDEVTL